IPLAAGGYWVVKSFMDDPETSKANMLAVQNHSTQNYALMDKDDSDLASFFEKGEEKPEKDTVDEGTSEQDESQDDETKTDEGNDMTDSNRDDPGDAPSSEQPEQHNQAGNVDHRDSQVND